MKLFSANNYIRKLIFADYREEILSKQIINEMESLENFKNKKIIKIIDYGSGYNPIVIKKIIAKLSKKYKKTKFIAHSYDIYKNKELKLLKSNKMIKFFHINALPFNKKKKYNFCLLLDVLHHIDIKNTNRIKKITKNLKNMSKYIFIKDHFQHGLVSNFILRLMDFVSNYSDNVKIPSIYFNKTTYENFISSLKIREIKRINDISYYKWYWFFFNNKKLQFISVLKK